MNTRFCPSCGSPNPLFARFCEACGSRQPDASGVTCINCGRPALPGDRFCDECGVALPPTALLMVDESGWRVPIPDRAENVFGREDPFSGSRPDIDLSAHGAEMHGVSRNHARLSKDESGYWLEDLGSVNLTYVNDQRLEPRQPVRLRDGDRIVAGSLRLIFRQV